MFGWINDCTECLVTTKFGDETWQKIKEKAGCTVEDGGFLRYKYYPDSDTVELVVAASEVLGITVDQVLQAFGNYFVTYVQDNGYSNVLECLGSNLRDWLSNLNSLHDHLQASYPRGFIAPVFWSEDDVQFEETPEGEGSNAILVHYYSQRGSLLVPLVVGVLERLGKEYFDLDIILDELQMQDEDNGIPHTTWRVTSKDPEAAYRLRGKRKTRRDDDTASLTTLGTTKSTYERTFREGGTQAAYLRVEEFVKRSFYNQECELYHGLTLEQYSFLVNYWRVNKIDDKWCFEVWTIQEGDPASWITLADLPAKLNPATMDSSHFGGQVPGKGKFPPDEQGTLQSFPPYLRLVNQDTQKSLDISVERSKTSMLQEVLYENQLVDEAEIIKFPSLQEEIDSGSLEIQCVVWNDETDEPYHTFSLGDLQITSTSQLFDLVPYTFDPVRLVMKCEETIAVDDDEEDI